jgi:phospholipid/cholesterol/gamma-HCH transport system substrate-binding protein
MRKALFILAIVALVTCLWLTLRENSIRRLSVRTYFRNARSLQRGTPVRVDGVEVGFVTSVSVRPELGERPVEVLMEIRMPYDLRIPSGSIASLSAQGVLGPTIVEIDTRSASGPPIGNGDVLRSLEVTDNQAAHAMDAIGNTMIEASKKLREKDQSPSVPVNPAK